MNNLIISSFISLLFIGVIQSQQCNSGDVNTTLMLITRNDYDIYVPTVTICKKNNDIYTFSRTIVSTNSDVGTMAIQKFRSDRQNNLREIDSFSKSFKHEEGNAGTKNNDDGTTYVRESLDGDSAFLSLKKLIKKIKEQPALVYQHIGDDYSSLSEVEKTELNTFMVCFVSKNCTYELRRSITNTPTTRGPYHLDFNDAQIDDDFVSRNDKFDQGSSYENQPIAEQSHKKSQDHEGNAGYFIITTPGIKYILPGYKITITETPKSSALGRKLLSVNEKDDKLNTKIAARSKTNEKKEKEGKISNDKQNSKLQKIKHTNVKKIQLPSKSNLKVVKSKVNVSTIDNRIDSNKIIYNSKKTTTKITKSDNNTSKDRTLNAHDMKTTVDHSIIKTGETGQDEKRSKIVIRKKRNTSGTVAERLITNTEKPLDAKMFRKSFYVEFNNYTIFTKSLPTCKSAYTMPTSGCDCVLRYFFENKKVCQLIGEGCKGLNTLLSSKNDFTVCGPVDIGVSNSTIPAKKTFILEQSKNELYHNDLCSIGSFIVKQDDPNCVSAIESKRSILTFIVDGTVYSSDIYTNVIQTAKTDVIESYECTGCDKAVCKTCNKGSATYKKHFTGVADCECKDKFLVEYYIDLQGTLQKVDSFYKKYDTVSTIPVTTSYKAKDCKLCTLTCKNGYLSFTPAEFPRYITICLHGYCQNIMKEKDDTFILPDLFSLSNEYMIATIQGQSAVYTMGFNCPITDSCQLIKCQICWDRLLSPSCYSYVSYPIGGVVIAFSIIAVVLLYYVFGVLYFIKQLISPIVRIILLLIKYIFKKCYDSTGKVANIGVRIHTKMLMDVEGRSIREEYREPIVVKGYKPSFNRERKSLLYMSVICVMMIIHPVEPCSNAIVLESSQIDCVRDSIKLECKPKEIYEIQLNSIGDGVCLMIRDDTIPKYSIEIDVIAMGTKCSSEVLYWSSDVNFQISSLTRCHWAGSCSDYTICDKANNLSYSDEPMSKLNPESFSHAGRTGCKRVEGGWGNGCFDWQSACAFYRYFFKSKNTFKVRTCKEQSKVIMLNVTFNNDGLIDNKIISIPVGISEEANNAKMTLKSLTMDDYSLKGDCFISDFSDINVYKASCNKLNDLSIGKIGQIQCPSFNDALIMSDKCVFKDEIVKIRNDGPILKSQYSSFDSFLMYKESSLPLTQGQHLYKFIDNSIWLESLQSFSAVIAIKLPEVIKLATLYYKNDFSISATVLNGCHDCEMGANLELEITSTKSGILILSCPSFLKQIAIKVSSTGKTYKTHPRINRAIVREKCNSTMNGYSHDLSLEGHLISISPFNYFSSQTWSSFGSTIGNLGSFGFGNLHWTFYITTIITMILTIIAGYALFKIIKPFVIRKIPRNYRK
jgi:hypothetical protein